MFGYPNLVKILLSIIITVLVLSALIIYVINGHEQILQQLFQRQHPEGQNVIVFVGGLNTHMNNCKEDTFSEQDQPIESQLSSLLQFDDPYKNGCPSSSPPSKYPSTTIIRFSYTGGTMDYARGAWIPNNYDACNSVNNQSLSTDVRYFDAMLGSYQAAFPHAHFIIVGHSLGGLVSLQGAYDYVVNKHNTSIDKVITIDSPLHGILPSVSNERENGLYTLEATTCKLSNSGLVVLKDLTGLGIVTANTTKQSCATIDSRSVALSSCKALLLTRSNVGITTLGNQRDSLYCGGNTQEAALLTQSCNGQILDQKSGATWHFYNIDSAKDQGINVVHGTILTALGKGHEAILKEEVGQRDILRSILAPVVRISSQPQIDNSAWFGSTGTPIRLSATLRCLWGNAGSASASLLDPHGNSYNAGTFLPTENPNVLQLNGVVNLPPSYDLTSVWIQVHGGGDTCTYSQKVVATSCVPIPIGPPDPKSLSVPTNCVPTDNQVFAGTAYQGPRIVLDGGKLAVTSGSNGGLYLGNPSQNALDLLDYSLDSKGVIRNLGWSHDGTQLAYLVDYGQAENPSLYETSSSLLQSNLVVSNLPSNVVALVWNKTDTQIALLTEYEEAGNGPGVTASQAQTSILIYDVASGKKVQDITLPLSGNGIIPYCGNVSNCYLPQARLQWGTNGAFLISYASDGSTYRSPSGKVQQLISGQAFLRDGASTGAMNEEGTLVVNPIPEGSGNVDLQQYQLDNTTGTLSQPTTLTSFPLSGQRVTADLSPDGSQVGICTGSQVLILDRNVPTQIQTLATMPQLSGGPTNLVFCEDLHWNPSGDAVTYQILDQGTLIGLISHPINGQEPELMDVCGLLSYDSNGFQYNQSETNTATCQNGVTFAWQPLISNPDTPTGTQPHDAQPDAHLLSQSSTVIKSQLNTVDVFFTFKNTGNTAWSDGSGYALVCTTVSISSANCPQARTQHLNGMTILPGQEVTFHIMYTISGTYTSSWSMTIFKNGTSVPFGQNHISITIKIPSS